jgi:PAS domain S-box-containing protein
MSRRTHPATPWIVYGLGAVLLVSGAVSFARRVSALEPVAGLEWKQSSAGAVVLSVEPGSPGWGAGILPGDRLVSVDGRRIENVVEAREFPWTLSPGETAKLELLRAGKPVSVTLEPGWRPLAPRAPVYTYLSLVGLAFLVSGAFIALRWPSVRGGLIYTAFCGSLFVFLVYSPTGAADLLDRTVSRLDIVAGAAVPALLLHLAIALSRRAWRHWRLGLIAGYTVAGALAVSTLWLVTFGGQRPVASPIAGLEPRDRLQLVFLVTSVLLAVHLFARSYARSSSALHRSQMRWMLWGLAAGLVPFILFYAVPWVVGASPPSWAELSIFPLILVPAAFTAALARYRLHDLDLLLRRGLTEVTAIFCTAAVYTAAQYLLREDGARLVPLSSSQARFAGIVLTVVAYPQLRAWTRVWVDRSFYKKRYSYRATLLEWARELNVETDLGALIERIRQRVRATLDVPEALVLLRTGGEVFEGRTAPGERHRVRLTRAQVDYLEHHPHEMVSEGSIEELPWARYLFGMRVKGTLRAIIAVAERRGAEGSFSTEDRALVSTLAAQAATAIEAARLLEEVREGADKVARLQARQESILESSGVGLLLVEAGRIQAWNRALEGIYALPRDQAIDRALGEVFPLHLVRAIEREVQAVAPGEEARLYRYALVNRAGETRIVNLSVSPDTTGQPGPRVIAVDDVTERVGLEEQVLQQERLAALGMLAAGVAHEVNTPLTGISSYTQMLLEGSDEDGPPRQLLEKIEAQTLRASKIANSLLNLARPERSGFERLSLNDTVKEVVRLFEPQVRGRGVRLETLLEPDLPPIRGHKAKLQQVLLNLLLNARDAVDAKGCITLQTRSAEDRIVLDVTDNGVGIAEEDLPRIFDPFFTTKGRGKGSGLGLSISYGIVREHAGEIQVESVPGEFTRFRIKLPSIGRVEALA